MVTSHTNEEINSKLRSADKSPTSRHQRIKFAQKQQALQHSVEKEHLSIQLLDIIQAIYFMIIWSVLQTNLSVCTILPITFFVYICVQVIPNLYY